MNKHKHTRSIKHRDFGKIYHLSLSRLNSPFPLLFFRTPQIFIRSSKSRFIYFCDFNAKSPYEFIESCTAFIAHKNYSIRTYKIRKAIKCRLKRKF